MIDTQRSAYDERVSEITSSRAVSKLLSILSEHARDPEAETDLRAAADRMIYDGQTLEQVETALAGMLLDGLRHGNWPWS